MRARRFARLALAVSLTVAAGSAHAQGIHRVVTAGQPAPGGGVFERFSVESLPVVAPVNSKGQVAFFATILRGRATEGFFLASGSSVVKVATDGDAAPGGGTFSGFGRHPIPALNEAGDVAFAAAVAGGKTVEGVFLLAQRRLRALAVVGGPAPSVASGTIASVDAPALNNRGEVALLATVRRGRETVEAIYRASRGRLTKVVTQGDPAPAGGAFAGFGPPAINDKGAVAFAAVVEGRAVPGGVFVAEGERIRMLVGAGEDSPLGGIFAKFSERVALGDSGVVAFTSVLKGASAEQAIFVVESSRARKIVALGEAAPGGGVFSHFGPWPAHNAAGVVGFVGSVDRDPAGMAVFVATATGVARLASLGDALPGGGTIASFGLYPIVSLGPNGAATFATAPTATGQGSEGVFLLPPAPAR